MLTIRREQMEAFGSPTSEHFRKWVFTHLNRFFSDQCQAIDDSVVFDAIDHGIQRAGLYGLERSADVCVYIDLMFVFGRDFDVDPNVAWAASILNDKSIASSMNKADRLYDEAQRFLTQVAAQEAAGQ